MNAIENLRLSLETENVSTLLSRIVVTKSPWHNSVLLEHLYIWTPKGSFVSVPLHLKRTVFSKEFPDLYSYSVTNRYRSLQTDDIKILA